MANGCECARNVRRVGGLPDAARWIEHELAGGGGGGKSGEPVFIAVHLADYERLRLYASERARRSIAQVQVDRYTLRVPTMIDRARAMLSMSRGCSSREARARRSPSDQRSLPASDAIGGGGGMAEEAPG